MRYYKIIRGYGSEDFVEIDETELEKACYAFLAKKDGIYSGGAARGSAIMAIQPDYHRVMGWTRGYKLEALDFAELSDRGVDRNHTAFLSETKDQVQYLMQTNQLGLIGQNAERPVMTLPTKGVEDYTGSVEVKQLADKLKIK